MSQHSYNQISFVVNDLDRALNQWVRFFGAGPFYIFDSIIDDVVYRGAPGQHANRGALGFLGTTNIEFFQPVSDAPSVFREILDGRGEGLHHILPSMRPFTSPEEFDALCAEYEAQGLAVAFSGTVQGVGRVRFYDALDELGQFIEVYEFNADSFASIDKAYEAHRDWDGKDPVRSFESLTDN